MSHYFAAYVLLGPPAAGKGTLSRILASRNDLAIIAPGNVFARLREEDSAMGERIRGYLAVNGGICPDEIVNAVINEEMEKYSHENTVKGFIFDGYPRTLPQLHLIHSQISVGAYIIFDLPLQVVIDSARMRRICPVCGDSYRFLDSDKVNDPTKCGHVSMGMGYQRPDDNLEYFLTRIHTYEHLTLPVIKTIQESTNDCFFTVTSQEEIYEEAFLQKVEKSVFV